MYVHTGGQLQFTEVNSFVILSLNNLSQDFTISEGFFFFFKHI